MEEADANKMVDLFQKQLEVFNDLQSGDKLVIVRDENDQPIAQKETNRFYLAPVTRWIGSHGREPTVEYMRKLKKNIEIFENLMRQARNYNYMVRPICRKVWHIKTKYNKAVTILKGTYDGDKATCDKLIYFVV
jgi:hypothetical protein